MGGHKEGKLHSKHVYQKNDSGGMSERSVKDSIASELALGSIFWHVRDIATIEPKVTGRMRKMHQSEEMVSKVRRIED